MSYYTFKFSLKDSVRDTYVVAIFHVYKDEIAALDETASDYNAKLSAIFNRCDDATIAKVEAALIEAKNYAVYGLEVDDGKDVKEHRLLLAQSLNIPFDNFTYVHQHHSDLIKKVTLDDIGRGKDSFIDGLECDALYTDIKGVPLCIFHADCVPIFFVNENANIVGIIHAGFKGTMKHIAYKAMKEVIEKENLKPEGFKFYIGPFRMKRSFQVDYVSKMEIIDCNQNRALEGQYFDNGLANILDLKELGFSFPDSMSNFIFATHEAIPAAEIFEACKKENIFVRYFRKPRIDNYLRISIGTDEEMDTLLKFLKQYIAKR